jgi:outer membrane protein OmpA-like peptidoglycan-associated protein
MKKFLMVLAFAGVCATSMAQDATQKYSVATNSFWSNWFVQANLVGTAFWGNQEVQNNFSKSPLKGFRNNLGFSVAIGKWFTPGLGLRTKFNGFWGRTVISEDKKINASKYWTLNEQVLFNLSNMIVGYNPDRLWDFIPYASVGLNRNMTYNRYSAVMGIGILNEFKINRKVAINLDINYMFGQAKMDGFTHHLRGAKEYNSRSLKGIFANHDRTLNVEVGVTYNLGTPGWNAVPDVDAIKAMYSAQIDALNASLADANAENARLKDQIKNHKCPEVGGQTVTVKEIVSAPVSVFFNIGKSKIASQKDLQNLRAVADAAKANNAKIAVTGYADSKTGSANLNQSLSQKRAEAVADALVNMGVDRANIETSAAGGVDTLSPISFNRRATVELK